MKIVCFSFADGLIGEVLRFYGSSIFVSSRSYFCFQNKTLDLCQLEMRGCRGEKIVTYCPRVRQLDRMWLVQKSKMSTESLFSSIALESVDGSSSRLWAQS